MKKIVGIALVLLAVYLGYIGFQKLEKSSESVEILGAELSVNDNDSKAESYVLMGLAVVSLIAGVYMVGKGGKG